eukprot:CAMPEP_0184717772 /NCGR_PEP_ID=MMETSP0314-20130426/7139_1 /TAXON_ID=38298 /ORGANISM="Rhodella maculata, Strain CCMP 736" /LENGTH=298 /DNA_ID=CAMNT_0027181395 /DNA_START=102 /DNA_END=994 /DNA_ORIENTATION=-
MDSFTGSVSSLIPLANFTSLQPSDQSLLYCFAFPVLCLLGIALRLVIGHRRTAANDEALKRSGSAGGGGVEEEASPKLARFQVAYLGAFLAAASADWLQDPFLYEIFDQYGISPAEITVLYVAGFMTSLTLGTLISSLADVYGRKNGCLLYCLIYGMGCITKNFSSYWILMFGRMCGGIGLSLLWSVFESWCVSEARRLGLSEANLVSVFTNESFYDAAAAIISAFAGHYIVKLSGSYVAPFNASALICAACATLISFTWRENYGDDDEDDDHPPTDNYPTTNHPPTKINTPASPSMG